MNQRDSLTFSQRHGYEDPPQPLQLEELPRAARVAIWNVLYEHLSDALPTDIEIMEAWDVGHQLSPDVLCSPWDKILEELYVEHDNMPRDDWNSEFEAWRIELRERISTYEFNRVFELIEFIMRHSDCPPNFIERMANKFSSNRLAYTIDAGPPPTILPAATPEEGERLKASLKELHSAGLDVVRDQLHKASKLINEGDWRGSIRESIHAVESVAKQIDPGGANTLGKALSSLQKRGVLQHEPLKEAFSSLYGYTNKQGIRHALLDNDKADVTIDEAVFMLGACASFASYLWRKHKAAGNAQ